MEKSPQVLENPPGPGCEEVPSSPGESPGPGCGEVPQVPENPLVLAVEKSLKSWRTPWSWLWRSPSSPGEPPGPGCGEVPRPGEAPWL